MGILFHKKKKTDIQDKDFIIPEIKHEHTWKDMPWYMEVEYSGTEHTASYHIIEPYICITCGERKNICLEKECWQHIDSETRDKYYMKIRRKYKKYLKPRAIVEDMINNILLVKDAQRLNMLERLQGLPHQNVGTSAEMEQVKESPYKINIPERDNK